MDDKQDQKPTCGIAYGKGFCGVCERFHDCPFADKTATFGTTKRK